jgi:hypothetical protein
MGLRWVDKSFDERQVEAGATNFHEPNVSSPLGLTMVACRAALSLHRQLRRVEADEQFFQLLYIWSDATD